MPEGAGGGNEDNSEEEEKEELDSKGNKIDRVKKYSAIVYMSITEK